VNVSKSFLNIEKFNYWKS